MTMDQPPFALEAAGTKHPAETFRRALSTLLSSAGGTVAEGGLAVTEHVAANMSVNVAGGVPPVGEVWIPGTTTPNTQGLYYAHNSATVNLAISASNEANPRIDIVVVRIKDAQYAGAANEATLEVIAGTPTAGAKLGDPKGAAALPASSLLLARVLVPAKATTIKTAEIEEVVGIVMPRIWLNQVAHSGSVTAEAGELITTGTPGATITLQTSPHNSLIAVTNGSEGAAITVKTEGAAKIYGLGVNGATSIKLAYLQGVVFIMQANGNWLTVAGEPSAGRAVRTSSATMPAIFASWGAISAAAVVENGTGDFTVVKLSTGQYEVKWTIAKTAIYAVTVSCPGNAVVYGVTTGHFLVITELAGKAEDSTFSFIAMTPS
jgi:hypothetical protein